jgi:hypothetical protein
MAEPKAILRTADNVTALFELIEVGPVYVTATIAGLTVSLLVLYEIA